MIIKEKIIDEVLKNNKLSMEIISENLSYSEENSVILLYTSFLEGLGTKNSDIDVYVFLEDDEIFTDTKMRRYSDCLGVEVIRINEVELDVEYWSITNIENLISKMVSTRGLIASYEELKLLLRIYHGFIVKHNKLSQRILDLIENSEFIELIANRIALEARSYYDDSLKMFESKEYILSLDCARRALWECVSLLNAKNGKPNLKSKWISKIYIDNEGYGNKDFLERYMKCQVYSNINKNNLIDRLNDMFLLIQDMLNESVFL